MAVEPTRRAAVAGGLAWAAPAWAAPPATLKSAAARTGRLYGCALEPDDLDKDPAYAALVERESGLLVAENALKWDALRPARDVFDFDRADRLVGWAGRMKAQVRGHTLLWHEALPPWFPQAPDRATGERLLGEHISRVVGRYAGRIGFWDVVNEPIEGVDGREDQLRVSPWMRSMGPDYIKIAFDMAHRADPAAKLAITDYGLEYDDVDWQTWKRDRVLWLLKRLKDQGCPIHALGVQAHLVDFRPTCFGEPLRVFLSKVADLGLEIWLTELDADEQTVQGDVATRDRFVADVYRRFLDVALREPAVTMVSTWGISDRYSHKDMFRPRADGQPQRFLPFDRDLRPKRAFDAMMGAFAGAARRSGHSARQP